MKEGKEEQIFEMGYQMALKHVFGYVLGQLSTKLKDEHRWVLEREEIITQLKILCNDFGDLDWTTDWLPNTIKNNLGKIFVCRRQIKCISNEEQVAKLYVVPQQTSQLNMPK